MKSIILSLLVLFCTTWFTGSLRVPQGKELRYEHMGYETIYEEDLLIEIKNGRLVKEEVIKNQLIGN